MMGRKMWIGQVFLRNEISNVSWITVYFPRYSENGIVRVDEKMWWQKATMVKASPPREGAHKPAQWNSNIITNWHQPPAPRTCWGRFQSLVREPAVKAVLAREGAAEWLHSTSTTQQPTKHAPFQWRMCWGTQKQPPLKDVSQINPATSDCRLTRALVRPSYPPAFPDSQT